MGGIVGRLFREFAVTLTLAIAVSLVVSLTTTPMMCARFLRAEGRRARAARTALGERGFGGLAARATTRSLGWVLRHPRLTAAVTVAHDRR